MLKQRVVTALILGALVLLGTFFLPTVLWGWVVGAVVMLAAREWCALFAVSRIGMFALMALSAAPVILSGFISFSVARTPVLLTAYLLGLFFWGFVVPACLFFKPRIVGTTPAIIVGLLVLIPASLALMELKRADPRLLVLAILGVCMADIAAYFVGRRFGKRKLAPGISPGKSWEGFYGGVVGVLLFFLGCSIWFLPVVVESLGLSAVTVFSMAYALASVEGDLFESLLKRQAGVKDSGSLLPGHGGVLDRIDSMLSTLPLAGMALLVWQIFR